MLTLDVRSALQLDTKDFIGQRVAVLGSSGMGKTNTVAVLLEQLIPQWPFVIFDIHNEYWGLCEQLPLLRVGKSCPAGDDNSPPVQVEAGPDEAAKIADLSLDKRVSVLVEMLYMSPSERMEFVYNYCARLWERNRAAKQPYGVVLEEAQNFIPQNMGSGGDALRLMKQFALEGRKFGFTVVISSQRTSEVSKTVLAQCGIAFLHGVDIFNDVQAYQGMLPWTLAETKRVALTLPTGEAIVKWKRGGVKGCEIVKVRQRQTLHVGDTPGLDEAVQRDLKPVDADLIAAFAAPEPAPLSTAVMVPAERIEAAIAERDAYWQVEIERIKASYEAQINGRPLIIEAPAPQMSFLDTTDELAFEREVTTTRTVERFTSSRALKIKQNAQEKGFMTLLGRIENLRPMHRRILALAMESDEALIMSQVAMQLDYSIDRVRRAAGDLFSMGLLLKLDANRYQCYVEQMFRQRYADLPQDKLTERLGAILDE